MLAREEEDFGFGDCGVRVEPADERPRVRAAHKAPSGIPSECGLHVAAAQRLRNSIELRKTHQTQQKLDDDHIVEILRSCRCLSADIPAVCFTWYIAAAAMEFDRTMDTGEVSLREDGHCVGGPGV